MPHRILVVDDEKAIRSSLEQGLSSEQIEVFTAGSGREALQLLRKADPHVALLDVKLPDSDGVDLLRRIRKHRPEMPVVMVTAYGDTKLVVDAMKTGAENYFTKPFDMDQLRRTVSSLLENVSLKTKVEVMKNQEQRRMGDERFFNSRSPRMKEVQAAVEKMAASGSSTILIQGETGTGKKMLARRIHASSDRGDKPFLEINCAAIAGNQIESELFGNEGTANDPRRRKLGLLEMADGGTVFLDEISELAAMAQVKLLRFLETRTFKRVGGTQDIASDLRLIAATNEDLFESVREKRFRQDLYSRLKVLSVFVPPLRERPEDLVPLAQHFLGEYAIQFKKDVKRFSSEALEKLVGYHWPGNIREMKNVVERTVLLASEEVIGCEHLPQEVLLASSMHNAPGLTPQAPLSDVEKKYILEVFTANKQNLSQTARILKISRSTLREKLQRYGVANSKNWH